MQGINQHMEMGGDYELCSMGSLHQQLGESWYHVWMKTRLGFLNGNEGRRGWMQQHEKKTNVTQCAIRKVGGRYHTPPAAFNPK